MAQIKNKSTVRRKSDSKVANIRHLKRIMIYLSRVDCAHQTEIRNKIGMDNYYVGSALNFLVNNKIVFIKRTQSKGRYPYVNYYSINPLFKK